MASPGPRTARNARRAALPLSREPILHRPASHRAVRPLVAGVALLVISGWYAPVMAQTVSAQSETAEEAGAPEIIVTAQRRPEAIVRTPLAISSFSGDLVSHAKLDDIKDLVTYTPGFSGNSDDSYIDGLAIRGIVSNDYGIGGDPSIGVFKDGVHQGRSGSAVTSLFDIERAEALRGPQGFLFGRNAISGAISIVTRKPELDRLGGHIDLGVGETNRIEGEAAINLPLGSHWALRLAGYGVRADGWIDNAFTPGVDDRIMGQRKLAGRASLLYADGPLRITVIGEYEHRKLDGTPYRGSNADREVLDNLDQALGTQVVIRGGPRSVDSDLVDPRDDGSIAGVTAQADLDLGFATLTSITGYRGHDFFYSEDSDGTPLFLSNYAQWQHGNYASQELRLVSPGGGKLTWSVGVSGYREHVTARYRFDASEDLVCRAGFGYADCEALTQDLFGTSYVPAPGGVLADTNEARSTATGWSVYGDLNYTVLPRLELGAGLRYTWDHKRFGLNILPTPSTLGNIWTFPYFTDGFIEGAKTWRGFTPRAFVRLQATDRLSIYASLTRGYKAGGFGTFTIDAPTPVTDYGLVPTGTRPDSFEPETVWSKEVGAKGYLFGRRVQFDVAAFHYVYSNLQTNYYDTQTRTQQVINVGRVHGYGFETALTIRPNRYFDVYGNLTYTRTIKSGDRGCLLADCGGLPNPTWTTSGIATARYPFANGEAYISSEWTYRSRARQDFDWRGITQPDAYTTVNLRLGYKSNAGWEANVYVQNLFDATYYLGTVNGGDLTPANQWGVSQPRNIGINFRWRFGD